MLSTQRALTINLNQYISAYSIVCMQIRSLIPINMASSALMAHLMTWIVFLVMGSVNASEWILHKNPVMPRGNAYMAAGHWDDTIFLMYALSLFLFAPNNYTMDGNYYVR